MRAGAEEVPGLGRPGVKDRVTTGKVAATVRYTGKRCMTVSYASRASPMASRE